MCIAIPPPNAEGTSRLAMMSPPRLMRLGALIIAMLLAVFLLLAVYAPMQGWVAAPDLVLPTNLFVGFLAAYGGVGFLFLARAFEYYPSKLVGADATYVVYGSTFFLLVTGMLLSVLGTVLTRWLIVSGLGLQLFGWHIAFAYLRHIWEWGAEKQKPRFKLWNASFRLVGIGLAVLLLYLLSGWEPLLLLWWGVTLTFLSAALAGLAQAGVFFSTRSR